MCVCVHVCLCSSRLVHGAAVDERVEQHAERRRDDRALLLVGEAKLLERQRGGHLRDGELLELA